MGELAFYVVGVSKYDPNGTTWQVQLRPSVINGSSTQTLNDIVLQVGATEAQAWQAEIGKTSQPITLTF
jgi:hypothetical protein